MLLVFLIDDFFYKVIYIVVHSLHIVTFVEKIRRLKMQKAF